MPTRHYPYDTAIHDLAHLASLSGEPSLVLLVSERSLYVLQNLVAVDAVRMDRYAVDIGRDMYTPLDEADAEFSLYETVANALGLETLPMSTIEDLLQQILDRLDSIIYAGNHSYYAGDWMADSPRLGFGGVTSGFFEDLDAQAGLNYLDGVTVPDDEVWVINQVGAKNTNTGGVLHTLSVMYDDRNFRLKIENAASANQWVLWNGEIVLGPSSFLRSAMYNCSAGDDIYMFYYGHKGAKL